MSANNQLVIYKKDDKYIVGHLDMDCGWHEMEMFVRDTLEEAIKAANGFMEEEEVEYGMRIDV